MGPRTLGRMGVAVGGPPLEPSSPADRFFRRLRYVEARCILEPPRLVRPHAGVRNSDTWRRGDARPGRTTAKKERGPREIVTVERLRQGHRASEATGTVKTYSGGKTRDGLASPDEHGVTPARAGTCDVEAIVHSVNEKYVCVGLLTQEHSSPLREPRASVAGQILGTAVGLRLDDARDSRRPRGAAVLPRIFVYQQTSDQRSRHHERVARVKASSKPLRAKRSDVETSSPRDRHPTRTYVHTSGANPRALREERLDARVPSVILAFVLEVCFGLRPGSVFRQALRLVRRMRPQVRPAPEGKTA